MITGALLVLKQPAALYDGLGSASNNLLCPDKNDAGYFYAKNEFFQSVGSTWYSINWFASKEILGKIVVLGTLIMISQYRNVLCNIK